MPHHAAGAAGLDRSVASERPPTPDDLSIRPPQQQRSREAWAKVLDTGIELLERSGYDGFTIAALSSASGVNPRALYERGSSKDALFYAVYEHKLERMSTERDRLFARAEENGLSTDAVILRAVDTVLRIFDNNAAFLRTVIGLAPRHPTVYARGRHDSAELGDRFVAAVRHRNGTASSEDAGAARFAFRTVYATAVMRTMQGSEFLAPGPSLEDEASQLAEMLSRYMQ